MRIGYADPPYIGCAHLYPEKKEVDHEDLLESLAADYGNPIRERNSMSFRLVASNQSPLAALIRKVIGATATEEVEVETPQFNRNATDTPPMLPPGEGDISAWLAFLRISRDDLRAWGLRAFGLYTDHEPTTQVRHRDAQFFETDNEATATHELWLFPAEWYDAIPNGFPLVDINGCNELFIKGSTDDDRRYGCLAYGVMIPFTTRPSERGA